MAGRALNSLPGNPVEWQQRRQVTFAAEVAPCPAPVRFYFLTFFLGSGGCYVAYTRQLPTPHSPA